MHEYDSYSGARALKEAVIGYGDNLLATGMARGAVSRGKRIAFGDGKKIIWDHLSEEIFLGNPNVAPPGSEGAADLEWIAFHRGNRVYNSHDKVGRRWVWNYDFRARPGEIFFTDEEKKQGARAGKGLVLIEPNVMGEKLSAVNKQWDPDRFQAVADALLAQGHRVVQPLYVGAKFSLQRVERIQTKTFRDALAVLANAKLFIGSEGGMHHGAAAVNTNAVVIFGSFIPPAVTGYDTHANIARGEACGSLFPCPHCAAALASISVEEVQAAAEKVLA